MRYIYRECTCVFWLKLDRYPQIVDVPTKFQLRLTNDVNKAINQIKDLERFKSGINLSEFENSFEFIKSWARKVGLIGLGALSDEAIQELTWKVLQGPGNTKLAEGASTLHSKLKIIKGDPKIYSFLLDHKDCILSKDNFNLDQDCSLGSQLKISNNCARTLHEEFTTLYQKLGKAYESSSATEDILKMNVADSMTQKSLVRVSIGYTGNSDIDGYKMMKFMDSMLLKLVECKMFY
jgi:hypothetical protein